MKSGFHITALLFGLALAGCARTGQFESPREEDTPVDKERLKELMQPSQNNASANEGEYTIGPRDVLTIYLLGRTDILPEPKEGEIGFTVTENPMMVFPEIGAIQVHGKTVEQLKEDLRTAYSRIIIDPQPVVIIRKFENNQIAVLGFVRQPGRFTWEPGDRVSDALLKAGGVGAMTGLAGTSSAGRYIKLYRFKLDRKQRVQLSLKDMMNSLEDTDGSMRETILVPLGDYLKSGNLEYNLPLQPNDIIYLQSAGSVIVKGRVQRPGVVQLGPSVRTVTDVLTAAGGMRFGADDNIDVIRAKTGADRKVYSMNGRDMMKRAAQDFYIEDGDELQIYDNNLRIASEWVGNLLSRGTQVGIRGTVGGPVGQ